MQGWGADLASVMSREFRVGTRVWGSGLGVDVGFGV